jgi:hypothetical protein
MAAHSGALGRPGDPASSFLASPALCHARSPTRGLPLSVRRGRRSPTRPAGEACVCRRDGSSQRDHRNLRAEPPWPNGSARFDGPIQRDLLRHGRRIRLLPISASPFGLVLGPVQPPAPQASEPRWALSERVSALVGTQSPRPPWAPCSPCQARFVAAKMPARIRRQRPRWEGRRPACSFSTKAHLFRW